MSNLGRIEQLLDFAKEEPDNPFNFYALALEYQNTNTEKGVHYFNLLLEKFPEYLPTYYHAGLFFEKKNELEKAKSIFEQGISLAKAKNDNHAQRELQNAYQNFLFENDLD
ncbi:tetratricopeptide repeat protein [Litoribacter ruber]|uniref:Tetratricopeptide repeat protein n=1 Tax=Litoribacter ruber TaxID=702568 RepID=A0AAP2CI05_9BACT|nr:MULTISPECIES: tetratricopeptide repeat protein [Litoribacter]MBS9525078.1 tetratricopeptide repeat protein [Litoribacter alkaliphilus]MBT0811775.1 tetratricopeptide repeat protein [Litoribacter ruber]